MKAFLCLLAVVAAASANGYGGGY
ncbi:unnamed protein product, partial [Allacma fusca]